MRGGVVGAPLGGEAERGVTEEGVMMKRKVVRVVLFMFVEKVNVFEGVVTARSFQVVALRPDGAAGPGIARAREPDLTGRLHDVGLYFPLAGGEFLEERAEEAQAEGPVGLGLVDSERGLQEERGGLGVGGPEGSVERGFRGAVEGEEAFVEAHVFVFVFVSDS